MAPRPPIDPVFVEAARQLAWRGHTAAEIVRALQPLTAAAGKPAPSYHAVRRIASGSRRPPRRPNAFVEEILTQLTAGRISDMYRASFLRALQLASELELSGDVERERQGAL
jgi:hypothetical protein